MLKEDTAEFVLIARVIHSIDRAGRRAHEIRLIARVVAHEIRLIARVVAHDNRA